MTDYSSLRKKFPIKKDTSAQRQKKATAIKNIHREYERKRAEIVRAGAPVMKKGMMFYAVVIIGLLMLGSMIIAKMGPGRPPQPTKAQIDVRKSINALATALGRYRYHVGMYPTTEEGLQQLASTKVTKLGWDGPYIRQVVKDPWHHDYVYVYNGEAENPTLYSAGPDGLSGTSDDVLPDPALFDLAFRDKSWLEGWMPYTLRGYVVAPDRKTKAVVEEQVRRVLHPDNPRAGETVIYDTWQFAQVWKDTSPETQAAPPEVPSFDSTNLVWKSVRIPHDWAIEGPFSSACASGETGKLPWRGVGYYRRPLRLPASEEGSYVGIRFNGVMSRPEVYLNGEKVGGWDYGYASFEIDVSDKVKFGEDNDLVVKVDTSKLRSRWYPGAGIFRDVTVIIDDAQERLVYGSLKITVPELTEELAKVRIEYAKPGTNVVETLDIRYPQLWSPENPKLYPYTVCGRTYRFGIRTAEFTADDGFHLNGKRLQLKGVNLHSDLGPLGMAFNRTAMRRQLELMKDMGVNAIRTSHNICDPQLLDLCDEMGFVVWDECFDKWDATAGIVEGEDLEEVVTRNLKQFVRRDRNHPCVVVWSLGNEIRPADETYPQGTTAERCRRFREAVRSEDTTRPVGMGCCHQQAIARGDYEALDLTGWNYGEQYNAMRAKYPTKPFVYSESASAFSSWGHCELPFPEKPGDAGGKGKTAVTAYDRACAVWADIPDVEFGRMARDRYCAGEFVWTGVDYLGEPCPEVKSNRSSFFGICDLMGMPKDRYYLYRSVWNERDMTIHLLPHWNWDGQEGEPIKVVCYTSGDEAELFLNGESMGVQKKTTELPKIVGKDDPAYYEVTKRYRLVWDVPYEAGELKVIVSKGGHHLGEAVRKTAYKAFSVKLTPEKPSLADGDILFVKVELVDEYGTVLPLAQDRVKFTLEGPGEILAVGNGSTGGMDSFAQTASHPLYYGRAAVVVRRDGGSGLPLKLSASVPGIRTDSVTIPRSIGRSDLLSAGK